MAYKLQVRHLHQEISHGIHLLCICALLTPQMLAHHLLAIGCFVRTCYTGVGHFYVALDGCCEISTIFLNNVFLFKDLGIAEGYQQKVGLSSHIEVL